MELQKLRWMERHLVLRREMIFLLDQKVITESKHWQMAALCWKFLMVTLMKTTLCGLRTTLTEPIQATRDHRNVANDQRNTNKALIVFYRYERKQETPHEPSCCRSCR